MLSTHDLMIFVTVADAGSVRHAATLLARTQPAISQAIQRLEQAVGFALLDRSGYRARLTERGELFLKRARVAVAQAKELQGFADVLARDNEARLRIAVHGAIPNEDWMPLVIGASTHFPDTVLELRRGEGDAPLRWLAEEQADLAIALGEPPPRHAMALDRKALGDVEFVNVVSASKVTSTVEQDLASLPQILVADFDEPSASYGVVEGHRYWRVGDHPTKLAAIVAGSGWGSVPAALAAPHLQAAVLRTITYHGIGPRSSHPFFLFRHRERSAGPLASLLWERVQN